MTQSAPIAASELATIKARQDKYRLSEVRLMSDGHNSVFIHSTDDVARLVAEIERLWRLHDLDHKLADHWKAEAERFEGMWRMECDLAASRVKR